MREKVWLEPNHLPHKYSKILKPGHNSYLPAYEDGTNSVSKRRHIKLAQAIFEPNVFPYKYSNILKLSHTSYLPAYEDGTECSETSAYKIRTSEN